MMKISRDYFRSEQYIYIHGEQFVSKRVCETAKAQIRVCASGKYYHIWKA